MYSSADKVDGQGVGSAYKEQVALVSQARDLFDVEVNKPDREADTKRTNGGQHGTIR